MPAADRVAAAVAAIAAGRGVLVVDDVERENEGDVIFAAQHITTERIAFLMSECRGLICVALDPADIDRLELPLMVPDNADPFRTAFTISVDARKGVTTGISAAERALSARLLADPTTTRADLTAPGHIFPLRAHPGGVRARRGHTEAAVHLARAAGLRPAGVICEVAGADGAMLRGAELVEFARRHDLAYLSIDDLVTAG
ncbi:MAG: 3,4-dihydroxy-2-butanone-4-phosphate synthase [Promicromonosporaceae bacterium]|nr:3,4-dihydroxy-2-butanone-4-phosphate synthase [Promicromonosporaceae bacterium]